MKTKVAKLVEIGKMGITEEEVPKLGPDEILIKLKAVGICGSDLHYFLKGGLGSFKENLPMEMGHEPAGVVADSNRSKWFNNGDRVAIEPICPCLHCLYCLAGLHNLCQNGSFMGSKGLPGALREYIVVKERQLFKVDKNISFEEAAFLEVIGVGFHSLKISGFEMHSTVAIFGVGPIGLSVLSLVKMAGASKVFVVDKLDYRLDFAKKRGADFVLKEDLTTINFIKDYTDGLGVDIAFDAAGMQNTVASCFDAAAPGGKVVLIGIPTYDYLQYNPHKARIRELKIYNVRRSNQTLHKCHDMFKDKDLKDFITHRYTLEKVQEVFELASGYKDRVIKAMVVM